MSAYIFVVFFIYRKDYFENVFCLWISIFQFQTTIKIDYNNTSGTSTQSCGIQALTPTEHGVDKKDKSCFILLFLLVHEITHDNITLSSPLIQIIQSSSLEAVFFFVLFFLQAAQLHTPSSFLILPHCFLMHMHKGKAPCLKYNPRLGVT